MALFLSFNIHQRDAIFSVQSRGKQCAFTSFSALLTAQNSPLIDWSTTILNVLLQGDKMYSKALVKGLIVLDTGVEFLSIATLPTVVSVLCSKNELSYKMFQSVKLPVQGQGKTTSRVTVVTPNIENGDCPIVMYFDVQKNTVVHIEVQKRLNCWLRQKIILICPLWWSLLRHKIKLICLLWWSLLRHKATL